MRAIFATAGFFGLLLSQASLLQAATWIEAITNSAPKYWYRFEETDPTTQPATNRGSATGWDGSYGPEITAADNLGKASVLPALGRAIEFTGPSAGSGTGKYVDLATNAADPNVGIAELTNFRPPTEDKTTTVEYWIKTTQRGSSGNQTWTSPSILARESGGDGDMYWGWLNAGGDFGFSTSDLVEIFALRDGTNKNVSDGQWHHIVLIKEWHVAQPCVSRMYIDGGAGQGGVTIVRNTAAGNASYQDAADSGIRYVGVTQTGGGADVQFIGLIDELLIYDRALTATEVGQHYASVGQLDTDGDGLPDAYELSHGLNPNVNDAGQDSDSDASTNLQEYQRRTDPQNPDSDGDGLRDGAETNTGTFVSGTNTGTDPLNPDTDGDALRDGVETNTRVFVNANNTGTNPFSRDTDGDSYDDAGEIRVGSNPNDRNSLPPAGNWPAAIRASAPKYWYRFEEVDPSQAATNSGSATGWNGAYGPEIIADNLSRPSVLPVLGSALEFTGPNAGSGTGKHVDLAVNGLAPDGSPIADPNAGIPELTNFRPPTEDKTTTVEYWIKTSQRGSSGNQTWTSPSLLARESGGDGDMYWGWIAASGDFGFSTSDLVEIYSGRDANRAVTDGRWHHIVLIKEWHVNQPSVTTMYIDGGTNQGGTTIVRTTPAGNLSYQDTDGGIRYLGFTQSGGGGDVQFIGTFDELVIYDRALTETEVRQHYRSVYDADTDGDGMPDAYEIQNGQNPLVNDAAADPDADGSSNIAEFTRKTNPQDADSDDDGLRDGAETKTGVWVSATNTGTDPLNSDTDQDGLKDGVETNTGTFVSASNTGTNPHQADTDGDGFRDSAEILYATNPNNASSKPASDWITAIKADAPLYWWRFEGTDPAAIVPNEGSVPGFHGSLGADILAADLGKTSANPLLGKALEFTGPAAPSATRKFVDLGAAIPELTNFRPPAVDKATTVEYWIKTSQSGTTANQTWTSPSIFGNESPGDGDMYWGWFNASAQLGFSTSDLTEIYASDVTDGEWHHIVLVKIWSQNEPSVSRLFIDGGLQSGGQTTETTTPAGTASYQDIDGGIRFIGFTQNGGGTDVQYIGEIDEVAIYNKAFDEAMAKSHYDAASGLAPTTFRITNITVNRTNHNVTLTWESTAGANYRVQRAASLPATWENLGPGPIMAAGATTTFTDTNRVFTVRASFYRVCRN